MARYSIGYNHDPAFLKLLDIFKDNISEVYFPAPYSIMGSGRALSQEKDYEANTKKIIKKCRKLKLGSNVLLNAACEGKHSGEKEHADKIITYLKNLQKLGLTSATITNPIHIRRIKEEVPKLKVHSSVNCCVKTLEHAKYLKDLGVDTITIDRDINRNIPLIKKIKKISKIKILLNEGCLKNCPFRHAHFNMISHRKDTDYFDSLSCTTIYQKSPEKVFSIPFIRPEDVKHYKFADCLKIATRSMPTPKVAITIYSYITGRYNGNLLNILSTKGLYKHFESINNDILTKNKFFEKLSTCNGQCEGCDYCKKLLKEAAVLR